MDNGALQVNFAEWRGGTCSGTQTLTREALDNGALLLALRRVDADGWEVYRAEQIWDPRERWWKTYEEYIRGRLEFRAERVELDEGQSPPP